MARGVKGRERIVRYFSEQIPIRRSQGGEDLFSQLCRATHDDGALLSTQDIVDHMSFPDDGGARHADLVADIVHRRAGRQSAMAKQTARRGDGRSVSAPTRRRRSTS